MKKEKKSYIFKLRFSETQVELLKQKAENSGFGSIATYIRYQLFVTIPLIEQVNVALAKRG